MHLFVDIGRQPAIIGHLTGRFAGEQLGVDRAQLGKRTLNLNFSLLSDPDGKIAEIFGVPTRDGATIEKEIDGNTLALTRGITTSRWTFVIDGNKGRLIYKDDEVTAATDPESVLKFIATHNNRKTCVTN